MTKRINPDKDGRWKLNLSQYQEICNKYLAGSSTVVLSKGYGVHHAQILNILKKNNISRRNPRDNGLRYSFDEHYFDNINSERKAYWLGFIAADGYVFGPMHGGNGGLSISLATKDREHLERFILDINASHPIKDYNYGPKKFSKIILRSPHIHKALNKYMDNKKTFTLRFPNIDPSLNQHFVRGYFDGDGSITCGSVEIVGNKDFIEKMQEILCIKLKLSYTKNNIRHKKVPLIITMRYGGAYNRIKFFDYLYTGATVYLNRKREKFRQYFIGLPSKKLITLMKRDMSDHYAIGMRWGN